MRKVSNFLRSIVFWSHQRGTLAYDILCVLILVFVFLTPQEFFQDQPPPSHLLQSGELIVRALDENGKTVLIVSTRLVPPSQDAAVLKKAAQAQLQKTLNKQIVVADIRPILGQNGETIGYSVWLGPEESNAF